MHWLIPAVTHSGSGLVAWFAGTLTPTTLLISFVLAASQSVHLWASFYGLFAALFLAGTCISAGLQYFSNQRSSPSNGRPTSSSTAIRTAATFTANLLVVAAVVPLHQYYLKTRLVSVPWYHIMRSKSGCLPVPSRSLTDHFEKSYTFADALGNQIPFGILISYALAMAGIFSSSFGQRARETSTNMLAGVFGALLMALLSAYIMPLCEEDREGGTLEVTMHIDRANAHEERTSMVWSWEARYLKLVGYTTLIATIGVVAIERFAGSTTPRRNIPSRDRKATASNLKEKSSGKTDNQTPADSDRSSSGIIARRDVVTLCVHLMLTAAVVLGLAIWSYMDVVWDFE